MVKSSKGEIEMKGPLPEILADIRKVLEVLYFEENDEDFKYFCDIAFDTLNPKYTLKEANERFQKNVSMELNKRGGRI